MSKKNGPSHDGRPLFSPGLKAGASRGLSVIIMYPLNHHPPHFHAHYAEYQATYLIQDGTLLVGKMPNHQARKIAAWYNRHQEELATNWERIRRGEYPETMGDE